MVVLNAMKNCRLYVADASFMQRKHDCGFKNQFAKRAKKIWDFLAYSGYRARKINSIKKSFI